MSRKKKFAIAIAVCIIVYSLAGFVIIPLILESILPDKLSEALNRPVSIENIRLNPFALTAEVEGLDIRGKTAAEPFVAFDKLFVNIQTLSLFKLGLMANEIRLEKPDIHITRTSETEFNFSDLIPEKKPEETPEPATEAAEADGKPFQFSISNIAIIDGNITFQDNPVAKKHELTGINLTLPHISNFDKHMNTYSEPLLKGNVNRAGVSIDVDTKPFHDTLETIVKLSVSGITIPYYFAYVPKNMVGFEISNGRLDVDAQVSFLQTKDQSEVTVSGTIGLAELQIIDSNGSTVLKLPELKIDVAPSRPLDQQLTLASVKIHSPELSVTRNADGLINLTTLGPKPAVGGEEDETPPESSPDQAAPDETPAENPFILAIDDFLLDSGKIVFTDLAAAEGSVTEKPEDGPVELSVDDLMIKLSDFTTAPEKTAAYDIQAMINAEAAISAAGSLGITPLQVETDFNVSDLNLAWAQPYIPETVQLVIADGKFDASGHAEAQTAPDGEIRTTVTGKAAVSNFNTLGSARNEAFVSWRTFSFDGINVSTHPLKISTDKIQLVDFKNQLILFNDGTSNLSEIFLKPEPETAAEKEPPASDQPEERKDAPVIPVNIGEVILDNFEFEFIDQNITPHFSTRVNLSELRVTGLTSEDFKSADLNATGKINEYAPLKIKGKINPLKKDLYLDVTYSLSNMELSPLSPYTGKYIGRTIQKGKLSTDVEYKIENKAINAQNNILLDQFTLGQKVDSKDALNLPVGIAISLLKDRNGQISLNLPVSGRTDDPEFGFGKPFFKALRNLIVKAATSPFDLITSVVGGGEELRYIEFASASPAIDDEGTEKLDAVKTLMYERPILKMEISGYVDRQADKAALTDLMLSRKIKALKLKKDSVQDITALDDMEMEPSEYEKLIKQVYADEILSDPEKKKTLKPVKDPTLTIEEMESLIRQEITVTDEELRLLAVERAQQVKSYLLQDENVSADRLFLTEPESLSPKKPGKFKAARVELNVR